MCCTGLMRERFDFTWSSCSIEHVGSIELGQAAVMNSLKLLKPGGVAYHTVEFNLWSLHDTKRTVSESIWRKQDVEKLIADVKKAGYIVPKVSWGAGHGKFDRKPNTCPRYSSHNHVKLQCSRHPKTSFAMIIQKPYDPARNVVDGRFITDY